MRTYNFIILSALLICCGCINTLSSPSSREDSLNKLLDQDNLVVKNKSVLFGSGEDALTAEEIMPEKKSFESRVAALTLPEDAKNTILKEFETATSAQKERALKELELRFSSPEKAKPEEAKTKKEDTLDSFIERLQNLPASKESASTELKRLPKTSHSSDIQIVSKEKVNGYPRTETPVAYYPASPATTEKQYASKIPTSDDPRQQRSAVRQASFQEHLVPEVATDISTSAGPMPEDMQANSQYRRNPKLGLSETAREATARRTMKMNQSVHPEPTADSLTSDQLLVMEVVWDHGELSFQGILREINASSPMAKTTDTVDKGRTSTTNVAPPLMTHDELQAVIYELEDTDWIEHQVRGSGIHYWAKHKRPTNLDKSWKNLLGETIRSLELASKTSRLSTEDKKQLGVYLRLLYVTAQRKADAVEKLDQATPAEQQFWSNLLFGISDYLQQDGMPDDQRNLLALRSLRRSIKHLSAASPLDIHNLHFIKSVESFGRFEPFATTEFKANQEVLLYAEIDNLDAQENQGEYHTTLQSTYEIFDRSGRRVDYRKFPEVKDVCQNQRRDFYVPYRLYIPEDLTPGEYVLELSVRDANSEKFGESSINFTVTP